VGLREMEREYLEVVAKKWRTLRAGDAEIPLTEVFAMLETTERPRRTPLQESPELPLLPERFEHAGLPDSTAVGDIPKRMSLPEALREAIHMVLLGEPGAGKSTTLQFVGLCFAKDGWAKERLGLEENRVPILLDLKRYSQLLSRPGPKLEGALEKGVAEHLRDEDNARELLKNWKDEGRLLLLLDGLDEVPEEARPAVREDVIDFALSPDGQRCRILVTSRLVGYASLGGEFREFTLKPFQGPGEALPYLKGWLAALKPEWKDEVEERAEALLSEIECHSPLRRVLDNPLLLRLIAEVYAATGQVVGNRAEIYERWIEEVWKRALQRGAPKEKKGYALERLEEIAWQMHNGLHVDLPEEDHELFREKMGLLVRVDRGRVAFSHQTVLEYFVARRLKRAWEENRSGAWRFLQPRLHIPEWREALFLLAGMVAPQDAGDLIRRVERAKSPDEKYLGRDLLLALRLWGEASGVRPDIGALLIRKALDHGETDVRAAAAEVLGEIKNPKAVVHLIEALRDEDAGLRWAAAKALGEMKAPEAVSHLIQALKDEDEAVRWAAARALGEMKAPEAVPHLIQALKDEDEAVRRAAVRALGEMKAPEAVSHLIEALRDEDRGLRRAAAEALGEMKAPEAVPHLIQALKDEEEAVRWAAAESLGEMKAPEAVSHLIQALKDEEEAVRWAAADALGEWAENLYIAQDPRERDELATLLHGVERTLRRARRRGTDVHEPLIAVLNKLSILEPPLYFDPLSPEALAGWRGKWEKLEKKCEPIVGLLSAVAGVATLLLKAPWWVTLVLLFGAVVLSSWWLYRKRRK